MAEAGDGVIRVLVVGHGPVAARLVEGLLPAVRAGILAVVVVGAEDGDPYNRVLVAEHAVGRADRERLEVADTAAAEAAGVRVLRHDAVVTIDRGRRVATLHSGEALAYDRLVLATGARAHVPPMDGLEASRHARGDAPRDPDALDHGRRPLPAGVVALRDLRDARTVLAAVRAGRRIVVLGAGVLGMELALAAAEQGADVVAVHHGDVPMARNLDRGGGRTLSHAADAAGVAMAAHARAEGVLLHDRGTDDERFQALLLADGGRIDGDLLVLSCGVTARDELASAAGLAVGRGVLVDAGLRSWTDPAVFAIGDCAHVAAPGSTRADGQVPGGPSGLIGPGWRQADALAGLLAAEAEARHGRAAGSAGGRPQATPDAPAGPGPGPGGDAGRPPVVMLKAEGVDVVAGGDVTAEPWDDPPPRRRRPGRAHAASCAADEPAPGAVPAPREVAVWTDPARGAYVKTVTRDGILVGFVSVGMPRAGAELTLLFERRGELPADRSVLLRLDAADAGSLPTGDPLAPDATVCWCNGVTAGTIAEAAADGAGTVEEIGACTRAGTGCGTCRGRIQEVLASAGGRAAALL
ncbi:FAD-dependent oxidoreductase [Clavibacter capsici]|uniref:FAD-dependent oxidoreductase n=1 Tax=Clavibacter capsici TaxID=1874630 RepID=UPI0006B167ED|nr:FAD-dependent oxidoreductase [Clavibacter capsici]